MNHTCGSPDDLNFGPAINSCHRGFDFTLFFEDTVLSLVPSVVFIPVACVLIALIANKKPVALRTKWYGITIAAHTALIATYCIVLAAVARNPVATPAGASAAALALISSMLLVVLASLEQTRALAPSTPLILFVACTALLDIARVRTLFLKGQVLPAATLSAGVALRLLLLVLESRSKKNDLAATSSAEASPEKLAGPLSRTVFHWVNPLLMLGFRGSLRGRSLGPIDAKLNAAYLTEIFTPIPQRVQGTLQQFSKQQRPLLIHNFQLDLDDHDAANQGYGLIAATFLVYSGIAASYSWYWHQVNRSVTMIRGGLVIVLFDKLLRLAESPATEAQVVTLMFSDTQRVMTAMNYFHELWAGVLDTAIATWLLYRKTGVASFAMLAVTIVSSVACGSLSKKLSSLQQQWLAAVEQRLALTKRMLTSLKAVKMLSASDRVASTISTLRRAELAISWPFRRLRIFTTAISYSTVTLSPPLVFGVCIAIAGGNHGLDVSRLFTSLSLINLLATPVMHLCQAIPVLGAAHGCMARIQAFLELEEQSDKRTRLPPARGLPDAAATADQVILSLRNASLGWLTGKPILYGINLDVKRGLHIAILGRVGSGKSLLLKGLLGEAAEMSGEVAVGEHVSFAYCSQTPWLENASAEENWTGRSSASKSPAFLDQMVQKYALKDIQGLRDYKTGTIGSQGAIARAASLGRDILLLDDVFSALDRRTKLHVAESVLRKCDSPDQSTVIFTTHDEYIANMADEVYEIDATGTLIQRPKTDVPPAEASPTNSGSSDEAPKEEASTSDDIQGSSSSSSTPTPATDPAVKDMDVYKMYLRSMGLGNAIVFLLLGSLFAVALKFPDIWIQWWSDDTSASSSRHSTGYWIGVYAGLQCIPLVLLTLWLRYAVLNKTPKSIEEDLIANVFSRHVFYTIVPAVGISIHDDLLKTILHAPFSYISAVDTGSLLNRFNQDLMLIDSLLPFDLFNTVSELYVAVIQVVLIAVASAQALVTLPAIAGVLYMVQSFYLRTSKQLRILELEAKAILHSLVADVAAGAGPSTLRAHGWQPHLRRSFMQNLDVSQEPIYLLFCVQRWLQLVLNLVVMGLVVLVAGIAVALRGKVSIGAVGVAFLNATTLGETLTQLVLAYTSLETSLGAIARTAIFSAATPSEDNSEDNGDRAGGEPSSWWPTDGSVRLHNLWARYQSQQPASSSSSSSSSPPDAAWSLRGVSVDIAAGQKVSVCGRTGSGKSTLLLALLRMVELPRGSVSIGGRDHAQLPLGALRRGLLVVSQDTLDESMTAMLREQMDPEARFTDEQVRGVAAECGLETLIEESGGLHARGGAGGRQLSHGEAQFVALAKVLLYGSAREGGILLLDEATSSLDDEAQRKMETLIEDKFRDKTVISVCHRLSWALRSDRIIVLEKGEIIHDGTPRDIVRESALFAGMSVSDSE
ncbi:ATP-binding cassette transporter, putative [Cordyceps militaris CM01]|uniref:ATP-binding cassette transporter, putative n=1 Tax=Cordyceps militaris (strain CM01) TaxID=983644 RepID=G3J2K0_CORMM|nr:ATP-binding cassette transporter, putative [Cordyceps militaris CM01]EGX95536.1 ATP-binding cassette transporter, putative [Cordyceps militaris CM01]